MKPIIGVMPLWDEERNSIWMLPGYVDSIRECGGVPIIFPLKASREDLLQLCGLCNGFLFTGGEDVDPELYNAPRSERCGAKNSDRDMMERLVFDYAQERDLPLLGICRGIQIINALCGGTLYQDLPTERDGVSHQMVAPYDRAWHKATVVEGTPLSALTESLDIEVNSYHHQAIKDLAPTLCPMAYSEDGLVEAAYMPEKKHIQAIQWHPELSFKTSDLSRKIFARFIESTI